MGFKTSHKKTLLALATLLLSVYLTAAGVGAWAAPKPEKPVSSAFSLQGLVFSQTDDKSRMDEDDAELYAEIFALQDIGNFKKANDLIRKLEDHRLMGHILYQRYTSKDYKTNYQELAEWMRSYADHPGAQAIYDLARKRHPKKGAVKLKAPKPGRFMTGYHDYDSGQLAQPYMAEQKHTPRERDIIRAIERSLPKNPGSALKRLETAEVKKLFNAIEYDSLRARVAEALFYSNNFRDAYILAAASSNRSGKEVPRAGWIAGLGAWRDGRYEEAAKHFERTAESTRASAWMRSAGSYWAARSYLRNREPQKVGYWLHQAAEHPRSFYGIIAIKALGMEQTRFNWEMPELSGKLVRILLDTPAGNRALALVEARRPDLAEQELRRLDPGQDKTMQEAMIALAHKAGVPAFEMRLGSGLQSAEDDLYDAALYPDAPWHPQGGYQVDRALVHAFMRQESKFDASVLNRSSGAVGLMQLLPSTAMNVAKKQGLSVSKDQLRDPSLNLRLGQQYLLTLLQDDKVKNNLFKLAVAYNAGPGNLSEWEKSVPYEDDPLLFIESIPLAETRVFVERVMTNYWIYRLKYNQNTDSLEDVASGAWPTYVAEDIRPLSRFAAAIMLSPQ